LRRHLPWLALMALVFLVYLPALGAGYIWDDGVLNDNPLMPAGDGLWKFWFQPSANVHETHYWPVVYSTFWIEYRFWGLHPFGYHFDNVLLHAVCAVLLWRVLRRLDVPGDWFAAALFAVHPVHVESVAWIVERKDVLSGAFYLGAALAYLRFDGTRDRQRYALAFGLFALSMLSKSAAITFAPALALVLWWKRGRVVWRRDIVPLTPFLGFAMLLTVFDLWAFYDRSTSTTIPLAPAQRLAIAGRAFWFYPGKLLWPQPLVALYPKWSLALTSAQTWLPHAAAVVLLLTLWFGRQRFGRGTVAAVGFYALTIAPALGFLKHGFLMFAWVADRFQYLAAAGLLALIAAGGASLARRWGGRRWAMICGAAIIGVLGAVTWRQTTFYHDYVSLFRHNVAVYPDSWQARCQLSTALARAGDMDGATSELSRVIALGPDEPHTFVLGLANMEAGMGRTAEASNHFVAALAMQPDFAEGEQEFAVFLARQGRADEAITHYEKALALQPDFPEVLDDLGSLLGSRNRPAEAAKYLRRAVGLSPRNPVFRSDLAMALWHSGASDQAMVELETALQLNPELHTAHATLGLILLERGDLDGAMEQLGTALAQPDPSAAYLHFKLGEAFRRKGRREDALQEYEKSLRLQPDFPEAAQALAALRGAT
jgi:Tfp pilus assembly protein PilF